MGSAIVIIILAVCLSVRLCVTLCSVWLNDVATLLLYDDRGTGSVLLGNAPFYNFQIQPPTPTVRRQTPDLLYIGVSAIWRMANIKNILGALLLIHVFYLSRVHFYSYCTWYMTSL